MGLSMLPNSDFSFILFLLENEIILSCFCGPKYRLSVFLLHGVNSHPVLSKFYLQSFIFPGTHQNVSGLDITQVKWIHF